MSHVDGPSYFPVVANLSLGSHTVMNLRRYRPHAEDSLIEPPVRLLLEPRSLLLLSSHACVQHTPQRSYHIELTLRRSYSSWMHGIDEVTEDTIDSSLSNLHLTSFAPAAEQPVLGFSLCRGTRVSLTIRHVPKARPLLLPLLTPLLLDLWFPSLIVLSVRF